MRLFAKRTLPVLILRWWFAKLRHAPWDETGDNR